MLCSLDVLTNINIHQPGERVTSVTKQLLLLLSQYLCALSELDWVSFRTNCMYDILHDVWKEAMRVCIDEVIKKVGNWRTVVASRR